MQYEKDDELLERGGEEGGRLTKSLLLVEFPQKKKG